MIIKTKRELREVIKTDTSKYKIAGYKNTIISVLMHNNVGLYVAYMRALRHEEYYLYKVSEGNQLARIMYLLWRSKKQKLGGRTGMDIPPNTVGKGFWTLHGNVVINFKAAIDDNVVCIGNNCIGDGNLFNGETKSPVIEEGVCLGYGAIVVGKCTVRKGTRVGAGAVVCHSNATENDVLIGVPAVSKKR